MIEIIVLIIKIMKNEGIDNGKSVGGNIKYI